MEEWALRRRAEEAEREVKELKRELGRQSSNKLLRMGSCLTNQSILSDKFDLVDILNESGYNFIERSKVHSRQPEPLAPFVDPYQDYKFVQSGPAPKPSQLQSFMRAGQCRSLEKSVSQHRSASGFRIAVGVKRASLRELIKS